MHPKISVIVATYNAEKYLNCCIDSILSQSYPNLDLIVVDGGSSDGTVGILKSIKDVRFKFISEPDKGIYDAWNKGVRISNSDRVLFIGADDYLDSKDSLINFFKNVSVKDLDSELLYGSLIPIDPFGNCGVSIGDRWKDPWNINGKYIWCSFKMPIMATLFLRNAIISNGFFDNNLKIMSDIDLVLKIAKRSQPIFVYDAIITRMRSGGISTSAESALKSMIEAIGVRRSHGLPALLNMEFLLRIIQCFLRFNIYKWLGEKYELKFSLLMRKIKAVVTRQGNSAKPSRQR